ncbi:hypothetical protein GOODEAATRI_024492 [Goodea atripinnis]|uniref:Uncharacterized protein n=1 Tax=Goodea atripinnis TaxID=208336 RepID=A0ABV0PGZ7_9TELE
MIDFLREATHAPHQSGKGYNSIFKLSKYGKRLKKLFPGIKCLRQQPIWKIPEKSNQRSEGVMLREMEKSPVPSELNTKTSATMSFKKIGPQSQHYVRRKSNTV